MLEPRIQLLANQLIDQIAAGEVIERPASAIKELVDNCIDAGAKKIYVEILNKSCLSFRVSDDGLGMHPEDIELAFQQHATSKIKNYTDLFELHTMGFRGEALASIASVSELTCQSKHHQSENAYSLKILYGIVQEKNISARPQGTSIQVNNLFSNTPARLSFLKKPETELQAITQTIRELALANPKIAMQMIYNNTGFSTSGSGQLESVLEELYPDLARHGLHYFEREMEGEGAMNVFGFMSPLSESKSDSNSILTIVNGRPVKCPIIRKAVRSVYSGYLPSGKHPRIFVFLNIPPRELDVNVHPTKREVRYSKAGSVFNLVANTLERQIIVLASRQISSAEIPKFNNSDFSSEIKPKPFIFPKPLNLGIKQIDASQIIINTNQFKQPSQEQISKIEKIESPSPLRAIDSGKMRKQPLIRLSELSLYQQTGSEQNTERLSPEGDFSISIEGWHLGGRISGDKDLRQNLLSNLKLWLQGIHALKPESEHKEQSNLFNIAQNRIYRPALPKELKESIWKRDNWLCVHCGLKLIHPKLVRLLLNLEPEAWITVNAERGGQFRRHLARQHQAICDHLLPYAHNMPLASNAGNLVSSCLLCNSKKSASTDLKSWQPQPTSAWTEPLLIGSSLLHSGDFEVFLQG